tara:strand:+ start:1966 stop:3552 length:1587 start_codon:yes stop_codon:yes gene_type:complete
MYKLIIFLLILCVNIKTNAKEPKLVVGIVVDQMRYDYVDRFWNNFSNNGFKKLVNNGYFLKNTHFSYLPTYTGPGHASIFTGTTPSNHGIIANNWYDKNLKQSVYCAGNGEMHTICNCSQEVEDVVSSDGKMSPHHMLTTTIGDEIQLFNPSSKVIGVSLKDRGAILSAGHSADAAYWMDKHGDWISSSFYMNKLPDWLIEHQNKNSASQYLVGKWKYKNSFSHNLDSLLMTNGGGIIKSTPLGNTILSDLALEILKNEKLGQSKTTDFLSISFSSTDYIGHQYGPHSDEIVDTYIKLDIEIAKILNYIEQKIGFDNVVIFLTADHGVVSEPHKLQELNIPSGYYSSLEMKNELAAHLRDNLNWPENDLLAKELILNYSNNQVFLNHDFIKENVSLPIKDIQEICADFLLKYECVKNTYTAYQMHKNEYTHSQHAKIQRGFNRKRSGDVIVDIQPGWISKSYEKGGTTHGSSYNYDTHVPLIFFGGKIKKGKTDRLVNIKDIAPTISSLLGISFPNGCTGNPIVEITE